MLDAGLMGALPVVVIDALSSLVATMQLEVPAERTDALAVMFRTGLVLFLLIHMMVTVGSNARSLYLFALVFGAQVVLVAARNKSVSCGDEIDYCRSMALGGMRRR